MCAKDVDRINFALKSRSTKTVLRSLRLPYLSLSLCSWYIYIDVCIIAVCVYIYVHVCSIVSSLLFNHVIV